jgi:hypothetical protein
MSVGAIPIVAAPRGVYHQDFAEFVGNMSGAPDSERWFPVIRVDSWEAAASTMVELVRDPENLAAWQRSIKHFWERSVAEPRETIRKALLP